MKTLLQRTLVLLLLTGAAMSQIGNTTNGTTLDDDLDIYASSTEEMELGSMSLSLSNDTTMASMSTSTPIDLAPTSTDTALTGMFSSTATADDQVNGTDAINATDMANATDVANATDSMEPIFTELETSTSSLATLNEIPSSSPILSSSIQFSSSPQVTLDELASSTVYISSPDVVASTASLADTSSPMMTTSSPAAVTTASLADTSSTMITASSAAAPSQTSETLLVSSPVPSKPLSLSSAVYSSIVNTVVVFPTDELSFSEGLTSQIPSPSVTSTITLLSTSKHSSSIATSSYTASTSTISTTTLPTPSPFSSELLSRSESSSTTFTTSTAPTTSTTSTASTPTESSTDSVILWAPIGGGVFILVLIVIACMVITGIIVLRSRRKQKGKKQKNKKPNGYWESVNANRHLGSAANVTMGHIAPLPRPNQVSRISLVSRGHYQLDNLSKPLSVQELEQCIRYYGNLHDQYMSIPANMTSMNEIPSGAQEKNRYCDVLPNPNSRVVLFLKFGIANSDYINANFIRGYRGQAKAYIATQGPLPFTVADFWRMIWEQRSTVIIMTTGLIERNMVKCDQYWPDTQGYGVTETYGDIQVTVRKKTGHGDYTLTTFLVQHLERRVTREVAHYWYTKWPDMGVPDNPSSVVDFLLETRRSRESFTMPGPTVVHCSAGIGRTGVFIAADIGMRELEETHAIDVLRVVANMRQDRGGMVQTKDQYVFLHRVLYEYAKRIGYVAPRMQDMNDFFDERYESEDELDGHIETTTFV